MSVSRSIVNRRIGLSNRRGKLFYLFLCQLLLLVLFPYLERPGLPIVLFRLLGAVAFVSAPNKSQATPSMVPLACTC